MVDKKLKQLWLMLKAVVEKEVIMHDQQTHRNFVIWDWSHSLLEYNENAQEKERHRERERERMNRTNEYFKNTWVDLTTMERISKPEAWLVAISTNET